MINKEKNTIAGIPEHCFRNLQSVGLKRNAKRLALIRECSAFGCFRIEVFKVNGSNKSVSCFLLFKDESEDYIAFSSFDSLLDYIKLNFDL